jgi:hypothetical protein
MSAENYETSEQEKPAQQSEHLELDFFSDAPLTTGYVCTEEICESCQ